MKDKKEFELNEFCEIVAEDIVSLSKKIHDLQKAVIFLMENNEKRT